jgi:hypothetical protein
VIKSHSQGYFCWACNAITLLLFQGTYKITLEARRIDELANYF